MRCAGSLRSQPARRSAATPFAKPEAPSRDPQNQEERQLQEPSKPVQASSTPLHVEYSIEKTPRQPGPELLDRRSGREPGPARRHLRPPCLRPGLQLGDRRPNATCATAIQSYADEQDDADTALAQGRQREGQRSLLPRSTGIPVGVAWRRSEPQATSDGKRSRRSSRFSECWAILGDGHRTRQDTWTRAGGIALARNTAPNGE